ncbi:MAG: hypothetical protein AVDCRST_MAG50-3082 [uncultured Acidimicrobiales bacterium]|uniref:Uncharacterized protein n=1 Tax=uncultured Acidimicrobiales bacterium TaxID=310071 RepID=A0A6J4IZ67_9ACTN|nr:MAG: hypothetical protein AVDCRST_MAG50-3082 [uncultured Acidimicrobiales bacterium]
MRSSFEPSDLEPIDLGPPSDAGPRRVGAGSTGGGAPDPYRIALAVAAAIGALALVVTAWAGVRVAEAQEAQACVDRVQTSRMFGGVGSGAPRTGPDSAEAVLRRQLEACGVELAPSGAPARS